MTHDPNAPSPSEQRVRSAVRDLPHPEPSPAFRERLRRDFVTGRIRERRALVFARPWYARAGWALVPIAAAALLTVLVMNRAPGWTIAVARGDGMIVVDGKPVPVQHLAELSRLIRPGARVRTTGPTELRIASRGFGMIELTPGTDMTVPAVPGRWFGRRVAGEARSGIVHISTIPAFQGARLVITTPEVRVEVSGTTVAVLCMPGGTCLCVLEGRAGVGDLTGGPLTMVPEWRRRETPNSGGQPIDDPILQSRIAPLTELRAATARMTAR